MKGFLKNQKGVTMMEVLVTVALLAIVVVPCLSAFVMAQRGNVLAAQTYNEYTAAQNLMEDLKGLDDVPAVLDKLTIKKDDQGQDILKDYNDVIYVIYNHEENTDYVTVWIFKGAGKNALYDVNNENQLTESELILKGVIAP